MNPLAAVLLSVMPVLVIVAALRDLTTMTIPNWISAALIVAFFPVALVLQLPLAELLAHVGVALAALAVGAGLFALRVVGGGDAKLMPAVCLWLGLQAAAPFVLYTAIAGGVLALGLLGVRGAAAPYAGMAPQWLGRLLQPKGDIPYGLAIAAGALAAYPESALFRAFAGG